MWRRRLIDPFPEVEVIRGVNSDGTIAHLLNKGLIKITGRKEVPGRPFLYGTTKEFLEYFGLKSLEDLPKIEEFTQLGIDAPKAEALQDAGVIVESTTGVIASEAKQSFEEASQEGSGQSRTMNTEV
jgi:segregation and condensation protein B